MTITHTAVIINNPNNTSCRIEYNSLSYLKKVELSYFERIRNAILNFFTLNEWKQTEKLNECLAKGNNFNYIEAEEYIRRGANLNRIKLIPLLQQTSSAARFICSQLTFHLNQEKDSPLVNRLLHLYQPLNYNLDDSDQALELKNAKQEIKTTCKNNLYNLFPGSLSQTLTTG